MIVLVINAIVYLFFSFYFYRKDKGWNIFNYLLFYYSIIACLGVLILYTGIYEHVFGNKSNESLSPIPYCLCFITYFILFIPFRKLSKDVKLIMPQINWLDGFMSVWIVVMFAYCILKFYEASISLSMGFGEVYELRHMEGETIFDYSGNTILKRLRNIGVILQECTVPIVMLYSIYSLRNGGNKFRLFFLIILCFLPNILDGIGLASRGNIFSVFVKILFFVVLFKNYVTRKTKKYIVIMGLIGTFIMVSYSIIITESRLEDKNSETPIASIERYFGESFPNLGYSFWDKVHYHPMGERLFPESYGYSRKERFDSTRDYHLFWGNKTKVPILNFKTFFGDLYIEFSVKVTYYNIGVAYMYFQICSMGFAGVTKLSGLSLITWLFTFLIGYSLKMFNNKTKQRYIIR